MDHIIKLAANAISTFTILSCLFLKVPQIKQVRDKKSAQGLYVQAMLMEITGFSIVTLYNFTNGYKAMTYLEYPIIMLQVYVLLFYTLLYKGLLSNPIVPIVTMSYLATVLSFASGLLPKKLLSYAMPMVTPINGFAKATYIYGILKAGNADAISLTTWIISVMTNLCRLFTIFVDSRDSFLIFNLSISTMLSAGVLFVTLYYQKIRGPDDTTNEGQITRQKTSNKHEHNE